MVKMTKHNIKGLLILKDDLSVLNYGMYTEEEYIELSQIFNELIDREMFIKIKDIRHDLTLLSTKGILTREKIGNKQYILKINDVNLDDLLWNLTETKLNIHIEAEEIDEQDESEDIIK